MLKINATQMDALTRARTSDFLARATRFIESTLHVTVARDDVDALFRRGEAYQLGSEKDFVRYMLIAVSAGCGASTPDPDWIRDVMVRPVPSNELRLRNLFRTARDHLPEDVARRVAS
jgi:hypothetical protein